MERYINKCLNRFNIPYYTVLATRVLLLRHRRSLRQAELRSGLNVEVAVLGSPSLIIVLVESVGVKQHLKKKELR